MRSLLGISPEQSLQERVARSSLGIVLLIMMFMPLPFCCWNPMGWLAYCIYLIPMYLGFAPLRTPGHTNRHQGFHYLISGTLIVVACSVSVLPQLCLPFFFVFLSLYLVYWQLEQRLYAIRQASEEYNFLEPSQKDTPFLVRQLVAASIKKALLPAFCGTFACGIGLLPYPGGVVVIFVSAVVMIIMMHQKLSLFKTKS